jgi:hypothetical protein
VTLAQIVNWTTLALTCAVVFWRGSRPERVGMTIVAIGYVLTPLVEQRDSWYAPQFGIMAVDAAILAAFIAMAFRYDRYWTICATAFQAIAVLIHFAFLINPPALYRAYFYASFSIGYLILGSILGGVVIERRTPFLRPHSSGTSPSAPRPPSEP